MDEARRGMPYWPAAKEAAAKEAAAKEAAAKEAAAKEAAAHQVYNWKENISPESCHSSFSTFDWPV